MACEDVEPVAARPSVYLAARFKDQSVLREWQAILACNGIAVTSRWLNGSHDEATDGAAKERFAREDFEDIARADVFVLWNPPHALGNGSGGRHVETGYALALGKPVLIVGAPENVFHWHPGVYAVLSGAHVLPAAIRLAVAGPKR